jgi:hydrogenase/urease accessory protein HupE
VEGTGVKHPSRSRVLLYAVAGFALALQPARVDAHLNSTGMGPVYDGMLHFVLGPEDLIPALALALLAGLRGAPHGRRALFTLPIAWLLGGLLGVTVSAANDSALLSSLWFVVLGALLAADAKLSLPALTALAAFLGLMHGYLNGAGMGTPDTAVIALLGLVSAVFVLVALAAALVVRLHAQWARIAVRVAGSWIVAIGLLMLGWSARAA